MTPTVGFVLPTYKNPQQILRLLDRLDHMFASPPIACHHDFSKSYLPAEQLGSNVTLVHPHLITGWGVFSVVEGTMRALQTLYQTPPGPDWFILVSEADYPIKPATHILRNLSSTPYDVHMHHELISYRAYERDWQRMCYDRYCTYRFRVPFLDSGLRPTRRTVTLRHPFLTRPFLPFASNLRCFAGEHWFCANRKAAHHLISFHESRPALANHYRRLERYGVVIPDESYYHTVLCNAPHLSVSQDNWRYVDWSRGGANPKTLTLDDMPRLRESTAHFARKFDIDVDARILDELDDLVR